MRNRYSVFDEIQRTERQMREALRLSANIPEQMGVLDPYVRDVLAAGCRDEEMRRLAFPRDQLLGRFHELSETLQLQRRMEFERKLILDSSLFEQASEIARAVYDSRLPATLEAFRTSPYMLATKLSTLPSLDWLGRSEHLEAFSQASALSDLIARSARVDAEFLDAAKDFAAGNIPKFESLVGYREFLDAAGLVLPRWPRARLLTVADKRRRFKARLKENIEPPHVKRAKSLVHRYELTLREILDSVMAEAYGESWPEARLPLCDCKDLLGKWKNRGGEILDHADYAHYARIMSHPDHFAAIFEAGFDDPHALSELMKKAGRLRAASHHPHKFTPEDLRDLRLTWRMIESGLLAFTADYELEG